MSKVIVMMGVPGAGKSTIVKQFPDYVRISQDGLGTREACIKLLTKTLQEGKNAIIDRANMTIKQRRIWITVARSHKVESINCIVVEASLEDCIKRCKERKNHETISHILPIDKIRRIVYNFMKERETPSVISEDFNSVLHIRN